MGVVYEAIELALGRRTALKVLLAHHAPTTAVERFHREARAAAKLHHTNIVPVFGVGEDEGQLYYVMQFIESESLGQVFDRLGRTADDAAASPAPARGESPIRTRRRSRPRAPTPSTSAPSLASAARSPKPWPTPTSRASSTATSSPPTSCSTPRETSGSPISAWPRHSRGKTD